MRILKDKLLVAMGLFILSFVLLFIDMGTSTESENVITTYDSVIFPDTCLMQFRSSPDDLHFIAYSQRNDTLRSESCDEVQIIFTPGETGIFAEKIQHHYHGFLLFDHKIIARLHVALPQKKSLLEEVAGTHCR